MKLEEVCLCLDCSEVFFCTEDSCPACASKQVFPIRRWIPPIVTVRKDRKEVPDEDTVDEP